MRHPLGVAEEGLHFAPFQEGPSRPLQGPKEEPAPVAPGGLQGLFPGPEGEGGPRSLLAVSSGGRGWVARR